MPEKPRVRVPAQGIKTNDTFYNFALRLGIGADNAFTKAGYQPNYLSRNRFTLESMYRGSWLVGVLVDAIAEDMTRAGVEYESELSPDDIKALGSAERKLRIWQALCDTLRWSRLYGGALAVMMIDGQDPETPLRPQTVARGQFKGLMVFDRWQVQPTTWDLVDEFGPDWGHPKFYTVLTSEGDETGVTLHHSRVLRIVGQSLPYQQRYAENFWGQSVIERVYDRLVAYDSTTAGAAQLVYKAYLRSLKIEGLRENIAVGGRAYDAMVEQIDLIRKYQSTEGLTLLDAQDEFSAYSYSFAGLSDLLLQFGQQFSGSGGIPLVRLFGQSPAGLNSTGDSDWENYYNNIAAQQEAHLRDPLTKLLPVMAMSVLGHPLPEDFEFKFTSLWQMKESDRAAIGEAVTRTVANAVDTGLVSRKTGLEELRQASERTGLWSNITDEEIASAEDEPLPSMSEALPIPEGVSLPALDV